MAKDGKTEIQIKAIIEVVGAPEEHLKKTIELLSDSLSKKYEVINKVLNEPKKYSKKLFSTFLEIEFIVPSMSELIGFVIDYHPSSVEIIEPEEIKESSQELTFVINDLISKIHRMDIQIKALTAKNKLLADKDK